MIRHPTQAKAWLPGLVAALCVLASGAQASPVPLSASASLGSLSFELSDLQANDGISPSLQVHGQANLNWQQSLDSSPEALKKQVMVDSLPWPQAQLTGGGGFMVATLALSRLSAVANHVGPITLPASVKAGSLARVEAVSAQSSVALTGQDNPFAGAPPFGGLQFTLSPHTALTISGVLSTSAMVDETLLGANLAMQLPAQATILDLSAAAFASVTLADESGEISSAKAQVHHIGKVFSSFPNSGYQLTDNQDTPWQVTITNDSDQVKGFGLQASVGSSFFAMAQAVPEPATWATWALGLALMGLRFRRQP